MLWRVSSEDAASGTFAMEASVAAQPWLSVLSGRFHSTSKHYSSQDTNT